MTAKIFLVKQYLNEDDAKHINWNDLRASLGMYTGYVEASTRRLHAFIQSDAPDILVNTEQWLLYKYQAIVTLLYALCTCDDAELFLQLCDDVNTATKQTLMASK